jgi:hypothetical protein
MRIRLLRRYAPRNDSLPGHIFENLYKLLPQMNDLLSSVKNTAAEPFGSAAEMVRRYILVKSVFKMKPQWTNGLIEEIF